MELGGVAGVRSRRGAPSKGRRWSLASRGLAALAGGYAFTSLLTLALSLSLPAVGVPRAQALLASSMASFFVYTAVIMAVFHASSAARAWRGLLLASLPFAVALICLLPGAAP